MPYVIAALAVGFLAFVVIGTLSGRIRMSACCAVADPSRDLRMRGAHDDPPAEIGPDVRG